MLGTATCHHGIDSNVPWRRPQICRSKNRNLVSGRAVGELQELFDSRDRRRHDRQSIAPFVSAEVAIHRVGRAGENGFAWIIACVGGAARTCGRLSQSRSNLVDQRMRNVARNSLGIVNAKRPGILGDAQVIDPTGLAGQAREYRESGGGDDNAWDTGFFGFSRRPRRSRGTGTSSAVTRDDRVAPLLFRERCNVPGPFALIRRVVAAGNVREFGEGDDSHAGVALLQQPTDDRKGHIALEHPVPDFADRLAVEIGKTWRRTSALYRV